MHDAILEAAKECGRLGSVPFFWHESIDSTNTSALQMVRGGFRGPAVVLADRQSGGRGRLGRSWVSPPGTGLYLSVILWPQLEPKDLSKITIAAGLAVSKSIDAEAGLATMIKWPNDVLAAGKKIAGILCESTALASPLGQIAVVLGIGVNVSTPAALFPDELQQRATSLLLASGKHVKRGALLVSLVDELSVQVKRLEQGGFSVILEEWKGRDATFGKRLNWLNAANQVVFGVALGPDKEGRLQVRDFSGRLHEVVSGDVTLSS